ncbi:hypothetical protein Poli38472_012742 [Pythium oligandrum]|uniref:BAP29/BAP31 transmembrane domain-containing protein n=1 Tax=Pythium oligandrum TaxID=41045 RepID=A0A8K1CDS3_PYTOL|nr:hypothetical protein Poli38472_012742 [Pythium oligandrum]|eukprot:TMW61551.1 hypothetical protein Poli38472_012742 [Pythium oligandrum]
MASMWSSMTYVLLPPALILLLLLTIPFPGRFVNRMIVKTGDFAFSIKIGTLSIFSVITTISFIVLLAQSFDLQKRYAQKDAVTMETHMHYSADLQKKATRWRSERNWWISALTFTIYWMLLRFHAVKKQLLRAQRHED